MNNSRKSNDPTDLNLSPLEVEVTHSFDDAFRRFRTMVQAEGTLAELKLRQAYEKPSEKNRRKQREAVNFRMMMEAREKMIASGEWEKRQKRKEEKRVAKVEERRKASTNAPE